LYSKSREEMSAEARGVFCYWAGQELGVTGVELAERCEMTQARVGYAVGRGEKMVKGEGLLLLQ